MKRSDFGMCSVRHGRRRKPDLCLVCIREYVDGMCMRMEEFIYFFLVGRLLYIFNSIYDTTCIFVVVFSDCF